jgi:hypothetical protein
MNRADVLASPRARQHHRVASSPVRCPHAKPGERVCDRDQVFDWIVVFKIAHDGNSPTIAEIMQQFQISSKSLAARILDNLEKAGLIGRMGYKSRMICVNSGKWTRDNSGSRGSEG